MRFSHFSRGIVAALLLCMALSFCVSPVRAVSSSCVSLTVGAVVEDYVIMEESAAVPAAEHMVSVVRYSAYYGSTVIGCLENGTQVEILGASGDFYTIDCYDMKGYIAKSQVACSETGEYYVNCLKDSAETTYLSSVSVSEGLTIRDALLSTGEKYLGVPYVWGGSSPYGFDCSGFTQYVFAKCGLQINRTAASQLSNGVIIAKEDLQCGDLVFFSNTGGRGFASHVGMYIGNGMFIHSGSSTGITITSMDNSYFATRYQCARRIVVSDVTVSAALPDVGVLYESGNSYWRDSSQDSRLGGN